MTALRLLLVSLTTAAVVSLVKVVPEITEVLKEQHRTLPASTALVDRLSGVLRSYRWFILGAVVVIAFHNRRVKGSFFAFGSLGVLITLNVLLLAFLAFCIFALTQPILETGEI